jgi:hypothetical protein
VVSGESEREHCRMLDFFSEILLPYGVHLPYVPACGKLVYFSVVRAVRYRTVRAALRGFPDGLSVFYWHILDLVEGFRLSF